MAFLNSEPGDDYPTNCWACNKPIMLSELRDGLCYRCHGIFEYGKAETKEAQYLLIVQAVERYKSKVHHKDLSLKGIAMAKWNAENE
jgi:hypothetical protein